MGRLSQALLWAGGLVVALLMAYTLLLDLGLGRPLTGNPAPTSHELTVGVFYPELVLWHELRQGIRLCSDKGLLTVVEEAERSITVRLTQTGRRLRFVLRDVRGVHEMTVELRQLVSSPAPPLAVIGSSNTVLTAALARALRAQSTASGPLLLVPWASTVQMAPGAAGEGPVSLLEILPDRTFRFCLNNQYQADLVVDSLLREKKARPPRRVMVVKDRLDPYSVDLANCFHRAVERVVPSAEFIERSDPLVLPLPGELSTLPTAPEEAVADSIWRQVESLPEGESTWLFLPLQEEPARRLLVALRGRSRVRPTGTDGPLQLICGDALSMPTLVQLAGRVPFRVSSVSSMTMQMPARGVSPDALVPAEIVAALVAVLDREGAGTPTSESLREALAALRLGPASSGALGRSLAFSRAGERIGDDLGMVLSIRPDSHEVYWAVRNPAGTWMPAEPVPAEILAAWP
ncbi:MAG: hypothetical protein U0794_04950 [Isosphaeraceae bacterium]